MLAAAAFDPFDVFVFFLVSFFSLKGFFRSVAAIGGKVVCDPSRSRGIIMPLSSVCEGRCTLLAARVCLSCSTSWRVVSSASAPRVKSGRSRRPAVASCSRANRICLWWFGMDLTFGATSTARAGGFGSASASGSFFVASVSFAASPAFSRRALFFSSFAFYFAMASFVPSSC